MQNRSSSNVTFIDVSHWEGNIDWNAVKASGIPAAYAKATEGVNYIDPTFTKMYKEPEVRMYYWCIPFCTSRTK